MEETMKKLIAVGLWPLLAAGSLFGQTPSQVNFAFDGGQNMTSNTGCVNALSEDSITFPVNYSGVTSVVQGGGSRTILTGYTQPWANTGWYVCFMASALTGFPGFSLYLGPTPDDPYNNVTLEGGAPLTYGLKTWGTRANGTTMDGTQDNDTFSWAATTSFPDGGTISLTLVYIYENTTTRHVRSGRDPRVWYTTAEAAYLQSGSGTYFFPKTP